MGSQFHLRPRFQPPPLKFRTSGFPTVRLQASGTPQFGQKPSANPFGVKTDPAIPPSRPAFTPAFGCADHLTGYPPQRAVPRLQRRHLCPEVLAQDGLCCPTPHRLATSSASLRNSASLPGFAGYRRGLWHSRAILPAPQTFRTFTAVLSRIAAFSFRREPQYVRLSSSVSALAIGQRRKTLGNSKCPLESASCGACFRRLVRSLSLRPFCLLASLG